MFHLRNIKKSITNFKIGDRRLSSLLKLNEKESSRTIPLLDTFGRKHDYLRISLTERCNLRCLYCMPEEGVQLTPKPELLSNDEIYRLSNLFIHRFGVRKIRLTGGEPLIRKDIVDIVENLSKLKSDNGLKKISITTNGILFYRLSKSLRQAGLDSVNISLDTLRKDRFQMITKRNGLDKTLKSIESALSENYDSVKINFVPIKGLNDDELEDFVNLTKDNVLEIRFIEYMPFDGNRWHWEKMIPYRQLLKKLESKFEIEPLAPRSINDTAIIYKVKGFAGNIGFISSMTNAFCSGCNRIRLTADGHLKVCLFGKDEISLKEAIRNGCDDQRISEIIQFAVKQKKKHHDGALNISKDNSASRPMILIDQRRFMSSSSFTHVDPIDGQVQMVDVSRKSVTQRTARARARIHLGMEVLKKIQHNQIAKGNVLTVAKTSAISAAKCTSQLIPLCHQIPLDRVDVHFDFDYENQEIIIESICQATWKTGVEMEAMVSASIAALTIYDMCKALNKQIIIKECRLVSKTGGKTDFKLKD